MKTDLQIDEMIQPIINIYQNIEYDLLVAVAKRFEDYETIDGALKWQLMKLQELGELNKEAVQIFAKYSNRSEEEILQMLKSAGLVNLDTATLLNAYEQGVISISPAELLESEAIASVITQSYKELNQTFRLIKTKALESTQRAYIDVINQAYLESASGMYDIHSAIRRGVQRMAKNGIQGATYKRGNRIVNYSIEGTVRRDVITAVHQLSNKVIMKSCEELGTDYVEVSQHYGARTHPTDPIANHYGWQGKVYKINGSDDEHQNLEEATGYPNDILGLGGVNCRHRMFPFWLGFSTPNQIHYDEEENARIYEAQQQQRKLERDMRMLKKEKACADAIGDTETSEILQSKIERKSNEINAWCNANGLKRDYSRELVQEQLAKGKNTFTPSTNDVKMEETNGVNVEIDKFTPCLEDTKTGNIVSTQYSVATDKDLSQLTDWKFNWKNEEGATIYKLQLESDNKIQGLIKVKSFDRTMALEVEQVESAPHNLGINKQYNGVGGHLFAIAVEKSFEAGNYGYLVFNAKNIELVKHYENKLGAKLIGTTHQYRMVLEENEATELLKKYNSKEV